MNTLSIAEQWSTFLQQYTQLYAQAAITLVRLNQDARVPEALAQLRSFGRIAGSHEILRQIKAYEETIPTSGDEMTEDEIRANKDLIKRLGQLRKGVK